jgi:PTH1 family peptidyl-tRNA hydrolase
VATPGSPWLVVGLGNPGPKFANNRHNVGHRVVELLAARARGQFKAHRGRADVLETRIGAARVVLAKPKAYMNESGGPVAALRDFFKVPVERIVAVHDELDLDYGRLRLKCGGGENGHNGLRSMSRSLGTRDYYRVRIGIGRPPGQMDPAAFVLHDFGPTERRELPFHLERAADAVESLVTNGLERTQNVFHTEGGLP